MNFYISPMQVHQINKDIDLSKYKVTTDIEDLGANLLDKTEVILITKEFAQENSEEYCKKIISTLNQVSKPRIYLIKASTKEVITKGSIESFILDNLKEGKSNYIVTMNLETIDSMEFHNKILNARKETENLLSRQEKMETEFDLHAFLEQCKGKPHQIGDFLTINKNEVIKKLLAFKEVEKDLISLKEAIYEKDVTLNRAIKLSDELRNEIDIVKYTIRSKNEELNNLRTMIIKERESVKKNNLEIKNTWVLKVDEAPMIIYFKEYEDIGFKNLLLSFYRFLKLQYKFNVKTLIVEDSRNTHYSIPGAHILYNENNHDLINYDLFVKYGNPKNIIKELVHPNMRNDIIVIWDRSGWDYLLVDGNLSNLYPFYLLYSKDSFPDINFAENSIISKYEGNYKVAPLLIGRNLTEKETFSFDISSSNCDLFKKLTTYIKGELPNA